VDAKERITVARENRVAARPRSECCSLYIDARFRGEGDRRLDYGSSSMLDRDVHLLGYL
jgi:hypothetical protein